MPWRAEPAPAFASDATRGHPPLAPGAGRTHFCAGRERSGTMFEESRRDEPGVAAHAYNPVAQPELFEGVLSRRVIAFLVDLFMIGVPLALLAVFILVFGVVTLGHGSFLFFLFTPISVIWALVYYGLTLGSSACATIGMRL